MPHAIARSRTIRELIVASLTAAVSAAAVLVLGFSGTLLLLGPEDAAGAGISDAYASSR